MKKSLIVLSSLLVATNIAFAKAPKQPTSQWTLTLSDIVSHIKDFPDAKCQSDIKKEYTFSLDQRTLQLTPLQEIKIKNFEFKDYPDLIQGFTATGEWKGTEYQSTKKFDDRLLIKGVKFKNSNTLNGVFADSHCQGEFTAKMNKP